MLCYVEMPLANIEVHIEKPLVPKKNKVCAVVGTKTSNANNESNNHNFKCLYSM